MTHVILGAGPAGVIAAETLRKHAPPDTITLVGDEPEPPYSRMAIPYLLMGNIDERGTYLRKMPTHLVDLNIQPGSVPGQAGGRCCQNSRADNGEVLAFDQLLIATGSRPVRPPIPGIDSRRRLPVLDAGRRARTSWRWPSPGRVCCRWALALSAASSWKRWRRAA